MIFAKVIVYNLISNSEINYLANATIRQTLTLYLTHVEVKNNA